MISNAEWEIMRVVWTKQETTSREILTILSQKTAWTASTVKTLLKRLVDKGYVTTRKVGKGFVYSARVSESEHLDSQADAFFAKFCQRKHFEVIDHLLTDLPMTEEEVQQLQALLLSKKTVQEVPCDCMPGQCHCKEHLEMEA